MMMNYKSLSINLFLILLSTGLTISISADSYYYSADYPVYEYMYGGESLDFAFSSLETEDGGYLVIGASASQDITPIKGQNYHESNVYLIKIKPDGTKEWDAMYGGNGVDEGYHILSTQDGGYLIVGVTYSFEIRPNIGEYGGGGDFYIIKINAQGEKQWDAVYGGNNVDKASYAIETTDGNFVVLGNCTSTNVTASRGFHHGLGDIYLLKLSPDGQKLWDDFYGGRGYDYAQSIIETRDQGFLIVGYTTSTNIYPDFGSNKPRDDIYVLRLLMDGSIEWTALYGGNDYDYGYSSVQLEDGSFIVSGYSKSEDIQPTIGTNKAGSDYYIIKIKADGSFVWDAMYGGDGEDCAFSSSLINNGSIVIAGYSKSQDIRSSLGRDYSGNSDFYIIQLDPEGILQWEATCGGNEADEAHGIMETTDGHLLSVGVSASNNITPTSGLNAGMSDFYLIKFKSQF